MLDAHKFLLASEWLDTGFPPDEIIGHIELGDYDINQYSSALMQAQEQASNDAAHCFGAYNLIEQISNDSDKYKAFAKYSEAKRQAIEWQLKLEHTLRLYHCIKP